MRMYTAHVTVTVPSPVDVGVNGAAVIRCLQPAGKEQKTGWKSGACIICDTALRTPLESGVRTAKRKVQHSYNPCNRQEAMHIHLISRQDVRFWITPEKDVSGSFQICSKQQAAGNRQCDS